MELRDIAEHINKKHRTAKQAQRDSVELFQALYFSKRFPDFVIWLKCPRTDHEDAVIFDVKSNGFMVFLPKYGIKGTVYLRDTDGKLLIPPNALSLDPK